MAFNLLTLALFFIEFTLINAVVFIPTVNITRGVRLVNSVPPKQAYTRSLKDTHCIQLCLVEHMENSGCSSANYDTNSSQCVINALHPIDDPSGIEFESASSWTWYDLNLGPPSKPSMEISEEGGTTVGIRWSSSFDGGFAQFFKFEYRKSSDTTFTLWDEDIADEGMGVAFEEVITELIPGTNYVIRLTSSNTRPSGVNESYAEVTTATTYPTSCTGYKEGGYTSSGEYIIDTDGANTGLSPFSVYCNMSDYPKTIFHHDQELRQELPSCLDPCLAVTITYNNSVSMDQIASVVNSSTSCYQYVSLQCVGSVIQTAGRTLTYWLSRDATQKTYWGGSDEITGGCACHKDGTCPTGKICRCDEQLYDWREDAGYLTTKEDLPMTKLYNGDTEDAAEHMLVTIGPLVCT